MSTPSRPPQSPRSFNAATYLVDRHLGSGLGDRPAVRHAGADISYGQLSGDVARVAGALLRLGMHRDERVMCCMSDTPELLTTVLGAFRAGLVAVPVSTMLTGRELGSILADCGARVLVCTSEFADACAEALSASPDVSHLVVVGGARPEVPARVVRLAWDEALDGVAPDDGGPAAATGEDTPALWLYTSGTTGMPKAAMHRHANIRHVCETYGRQVLGIRAEDRCLSVAKLFFAYGIGNSAFFPLSAGATTILEPRRPTPDVIAERVSADRPTLFFGVPTFYAGMLAADLPEELMSSVRLAVSAGEALPAPLLRRWRDRFGVEIIDGLGSTEALHIFLSNRPGDVGPGTSGFPVPGYELQIRDEHGAVRPPGEPGSLYVKGESIASGYWCRTETSRHVFQGDWLATGDTYVQDEEGRYTCLGRSNDMLKAGGIWVSPAEVEDRLAEHEDVSEAAVVGVPDGEGLDKPVAYVVLGKGATATPEELIGFCRDGLAHFKAPRRVVCVDALPRTATGKLQRFKIRRLAAEESGAASTA
ncbi:benzoate--CoA ligase [Streptomyces abyssalis]|uniref:Benzoate--CoA ligase n=1 Tax=Streptomyces abyssalis TaxID=933944 RepID=A0A1E7JN99_9ACTN|nr:benzoate-CoA ligase family protein [Streptomyces abyssalis]OEU86859.1 benzoate--CoA ligase [Streptomyces abyssalis]OEU89757.1 benzoate--CoA ligase [Streptomyces abyssalis]OEV30899.1 benzoate--CoA ligase [Streptomyces nanshensis]